MQLTLDRAQEIVEHYNNSNNKYTGIFKSINVLPYSAEEIKHSVKYLLLFYSELYKQNGILKEEFAGLIDSHIQIYISIATYIEDEKILKILQNSKVINETFANFTDMYQAIEVIQMVNVTSEVYDDFLKTANSIIKLEGEIQRFIREKCITLN
ncbi:MAG: hypothetical protein KDC73_10970 [Ignavibacteriae bacterium]|nr:hypothetical protein [Ignavibacteriota bacterium]MCB0725211.1 hypothetical protein [Ignavibacteriota bacterium]MCB9242465.1 hypothetical protein [Ignavibacteriales bacterium]